MTFLTDSTVVHHPHFCTSILGFSYFWSCFQISQQAKIQPTNQPWRFRPAASSRQVGFAAEPGDVQVGFSEVYGRIAKDAKDPAVRDVWMIPTWNAKCPIFWGNFTPKISNYIAALGFPGSWAMKKGPHVSVGTLGFHRKIMLPTYFVIMISHGKDGYRLVVGKLKFR